MAQLLPAFPGLGQHSCPQPHASFTSFQGAYASSLVVLSLGELGKKTKQKTLCLDSLCFWAGGPPYHIRMPRQ